MITPEQAESARALKDAGATWDDLARRYKRNSRTLRRTLRGMWSKGPRESEVGPNECAEPAANDVSPTTVRSVAPEAMRPEALPPICDPQIVSGLEKILIIPDTHVPFEDGAAFATMMAAARVFRPDRIVLLGDFADCEAVSDHPKGLERGFTFEEEVAAVNARLDELDSLGVATKTYVSGNHEYRIARYLARQARELSYLINAPGLYRLQERGWKWVPYFETEPVGQMNYTHDTGKSGVTAHRASRLDFEGDGSVTIGHTHTLGLEVINTAKGRALMSMSLGWLGDKRKIAYMHQRKAARWPLAFGIAYHERDTGNVHVVPIPIVDYRCVIEGHLIDPLKGTSADPRARVSA